MSEDLYKSEPKKAWQSKTLWTNLLLAAAAFFPPAQPYLTPEVIATVFGLVNAGLRFVTKTGVTLK